ncbi:hypothetical protein [Vallitalea okinawensis]|uniref:hypothetical protein n=1 Tax=Vallitalea okinawensis TaxID=2078660 RepID=UPI000CFD24F6|nr:hypothetical protein [Vallitalea okinawensis]
MIEIHYEGDFSFSSTSSIIFSKFYIKIETSSFPCKDWTDMPFAVLRMWCESLISNVINMNSNNFELYFMDGPFLIECKRNKDQILMDFINNRNGRKVEYRYSISTKELIKIISEVSKRLIWLAEKRNFGETRDVVELKKLVKLLV